MNILQIISGRSVNGAHVYCKILSEKLAERGHRVTIVCKPNAWIKKNVDSNRVNVVESTLARLPFSEFKRIKSLIVDQSIDLIHTHMTRAQNFGVGLKFITGVPLIATAHNRHFEVHWNFNDFVIANSNSTYQYHARVNRIPSSKMDTIYCCSDYERFESIRPENLELIRKRLRLDRDDFLVNVVGEMAARKGHIHFVHAIPKILKQIPNLKVVFVGRFGRKQSHIRQIRNFILQNNLAGRIKWVGRKSNVADYMAASEISVVPSIEEPLGLVAIESLLAGTPVIASDTGGLKEIVKHGQTGLLVPTADPSALAEAVVQLAQSSKTRSQLGQQGQRFVQKNFATDILIDRVEQVYRQLVERKKAA